MTQGRPPPRPPTFPVERVCAGCGRPKGTIPIARNGYWHLRCWRKATSRDRPRKGVR